MKFINQDSMFENIDTYHLTQKLHRFYFIVIFCIFFLKKMGNYIYQLIMNCL